MSAGAPADGSLRGLLLDYGGVLTSNVFDSFREFCVREGLEPDALKRLFREDPSAREQIRALERGDLREEEFAERFGPLLGIENTENLIDRMFAGMGPDEEMLAAVRAARRAGVRTGLLSNSLGRGRYDRSQFSELFDGVVISGEVGMHKPQPEIFRLGAERIGLVPEQCLFVDDLKENCEGAEAVGMTAILHRGAEGTVPELERLLGVTLR